MEVEVEVVVEVEVEVDSGPYSPAVEVVAEVAEVVDTRSRTMAVEVGVVEEADGLGPYTLGEGPFLPCIGHEASLVWTVGISAIQGVAQTVLIPLPLRHLSLPSMVRCSR